ncbi:hypothetical protein DS884_05250 [Tenacibaculum sp. E3R01]|uniref:helix-turn-helix domain-containing protein n=1 Tax=Tenacibaculum sp. E3R01 TaxID=2267227 RepID=UPI000DE92334|nr:helix-turn-helix domain-containing protein [Tenacibaculum sp. E3R01]RBW59157.1 hypothetical protein DS884_05250 [Tenacibaculum sp. E3R01]
MDTNFNFFNSLIIGGVIHGVIFAFIILFNKKHKSILNSLLAQVVLYLSLSNLYYWFIDTNLSSQIPYYDILYIPWYLLILPTYYTFVSKYLNNTPKQYIPFFIPFYVSLFINLCILIYIVFYKTNTSYTLFYHIEEYLSVVFTVLIIYKTYILINQYTTKHKKYIINEVKKETKWLVHLLLFGIFICVFWSLTIGKLNSEIRYILWLSISLLVYWLGYNGIYYNGIFNQRTALREATTNKIIEQPKEDKEKTSWIKGIIENQKLYLNPNFGLPELAKETNLNESYLSHVFNKNSTINFTSYINKLRVKEAEKLLKHLDYKEYTIVAIALEAGFNSKSAFYTNFKKETSKTPIQFRKENLS